MTVAGADEVQRTEGRISKFLGLWEDFKSMDLDPWNPIWIWAKSKSNSFNLSKQRIWIWTPSNPNPNPNLCHPNRLLKICSWRFVLWRFVQEIFPFEILFRRFFLLRFVQERRFIWRFFLERRFILWRFVKEIYHFEDFFRRFILWRFVQEIFPF